MEGDNLYLNKFFKINRKELIFLVVILYIFNIKLGIVGTILLGLIYVLRTYESNYYRDVSFDESLETCRESTMNNPYANYNMYEDGNLKACKNPREKTIEMYILKNIFLKSLNLNIQKMKN